MVLRVRSYGVPQEDGKVFNATRRFGSEHQNVELFLSGELPE